MRLKLIAEKYTYDIEDKFNSYMTQNNDIDIIKITTTYQGDRHMMYIYYYTFSELRNKKIKKLQDNIEFNHK